MERCDNLLCLDGTSCRCGLTKEQIQIEGDYYRYDLHKRRRVSGVLTVALGDVLRIGLTKTYSRLMFLFPMAFGFLSLIIKAIPAAEISVEVIPGVYSVGHTFWSVPFQDTAWIICAVLCLLTIPLYWLSYRNDLEINTTKGRYLLPRKGMRAQDIGAFQQQLSKLKAESKRTQKMI